MEQEFTTPEIWKFLDEIEESSKGLDEWESKFIEDMIEYRDNRRNFSIKQAEIIHRIYVVKT